MGLFDGTSLQRPITCPACGKALAECKCPRDAVGEVCLPKDQDARVRREQRRGKFVTVVTGLDPKATDLAALLKQCRKQYATGGGLREDGFELQGDHRERMVESLRAMGYPAKAAGG
ncbi:MAG: translation initiation factor [Phycisphaeraceae bacterium]